MLVDYSREDIQTCQVGYIYICLISFCIHLRNTSHFLSVLTSASANMDILLFYFGWALHIPFIPRLFFSFPGSPRMVSFLANKLPKRLVRGQCCDISCYVDGDYGKGWNELSM
jgi:hypothetical protein